MNFKVDTVQTLSAIRSIVFVVLLTGTSGCSALFSDCLDGSGELRTDSRSVPAFTNIVVKGSADVIFTQGNEQQLLITADDNLLPIITTDVSNNTLTIDAKECYSASQQLKVEVTIPRLALFKTEGSGSLTNLPSASNEKLTLDDLRIQIEGSGKVNLLDALIDNLKIEIEGSGEATVTGGGESITVNISGSGEITADEFLVKDATATISGSGKILLQATERLKGVIAGSGKIYYRGDPKALETTISGSGNIIKLD
ncbi:MAG: head GIN domain-containing protein [Candidatus Kapaibacterium sp.]